MKKIEKLTPEQEARFPEFVRKWIDIGLSTQPADRERAERAIAGLYGLAKLRQPRVIWLPCPISAALSAVCYSALIKKRLVSEENKPVGSAVGGAVYSAVDSAVYSAVGGAVGSAVDSAVRGAVGGAVRGAVDSAVGSAVYSAGYSYFGGSLWNAGYSAWADYFNEACGVAIDRNFLEMTESCGFYWTLDDVVFASERPSEIHLDDAGRLHSENGMAIRYAGTGWGLSYWHGVRVPDYWLIDRASLNPNEVVKVDNVEQRAAGAAIVGWTKMLSVLKAKVIDDSGSPDIGQLIELKLPGLSQAGRFLKASCPRNGTIVEGVPRVSDVDGLPIETAIAAQAWRIGDPQSEYQHPPRRT